MKSPGRTRTRRRTQLGPADRPLERLCGDGPVPDLASLPNPATGMRVAVTGATGLVGHFIVEGCWRTAMR